MSLLLRVEYAALFISALIAYSMIGGGWWLFAALILVPDLSMLGYLGGPRIGAFFYNAVHSWIAPAALFLVAWLSDVPIVLECSLILAAHIAADRALGFGLKHTSGFKDTHLGRIGDSGAPTAG